MTHRPDSLEGRKILFIYNNLKGGGVERVGISLVGGLRSLGAEVDLLLISDAYDYDTTPLSGANVYALLPEGGRISRNPVRFLSGFLKVALQYDIIVGGIEKLPSYMAALLGFVARKKSLITFHANMSCYLERSVFRRLHRFMTMLSCKMADGVLCVSHGVKDDLVSSFGVRESSVDVVYNPAFPGRYAEAASEEISGEAAPAYNKPVLINAGRLGYHKGQDVLLKAFRKVVDAGWDVNLVVLGEGPDRPAVERLAEELGVSDRVYLPGFETNPYNYMSRSKLFVLSSRFEGFANVLLESMSLGVPVVSTDCASGPGEILDGGRYGLLVPVDDPDSLAEAVVTVLADERLSARLSASGIERVKDFDEARTFENYYEVLVSL